MFCWTRALKYWIDHADDVSMFANFDLHHACITTPIVTICWSISAWAVWLCQTA
jgi:hypothetical protein